MASSYKNLPKTLDPRAPVTPSDNPLHSCLNFKIPIYHMDFCSQTGLGVFFSEPTNNAHLTSEHSENLLQLNFLSRDLIHLPTNICFEGLT